MNKSIYAIAKALFVKHNFDYDIAFLSVWYFHHPGETPTASLPQISARMDAVRHIPVVTSADADRYLAAYAGQKKLGADPEAALRMVIRGFDHEAELPEEKVLP